MTPEQIEYAKSKIVKIRKIAYSKTKKRFIVKEPNPLTVESFEELINSGSIKFIRRSRSLTSHHRLGDLFDLSGFNSNPEYDHEAYNEALVPIDKAFDAAMDELMLGDSKEALKLIKEFSKFCEEQ